MADESRGLEHLTDRELLLITVQTVTEVKVLAQNTNGRVTKLERRQDTADGALSMLRFVIVVLMLPLMALGVGVAGLVLTRV